jgi:N-acetylated-alpha-linked acidic dipeptidase
MEHCRGAVAFSIFLLAAGAGVAGAQEELRYWPPSERAAELELEAVVDANTSAERLGEWHAQLTREPHVAGSAADGRLVKNLAAAFEGMGLATEVQPFSPYLASPVAAEVEIVSQPSTPDGMEGAFGDTADAVLPLALSVQEEALDEDPFSSHPDLKIGWNAYSGSGEVTAEVVYANFGTREDFEQLEKMGVDVAGKVVLARYGRNFRGYKAAFGERHGAAAMILFVDPAQGGFTRGLPYPVGGWANPSYIQRGSILTLPYPGDPLTPFEPATPEAARLDPDTLALPKIPVQPVGWRSAWEILRRMRGVPVPAEWQGGLPMTYRLTGGSDLRVRVSVEQTRGLAETANVVGRILGSEHPEELVIIGSHFDAWSFGAVDPNAGSMLVLESARAFSEAVKRGYRPRRTLVFAHWGAEEFGIMGSTEWVEAHRAELLEDAVAYVNLDSAAAGLEFGASAAPSLKAIVSDAARAVAHPSAEYETVLDQWSAGSEEGPEFGNLGGGSDHVGFYCHVGVPSVGLGAGGSPGTSYHSNYDDLAWYRQVVGGDYASALMVTRVVNVFAARMANAPLLPLDPVQYSTDTRVHLDALESRAKELGEVGEFSDVRSAAAAYDAVARPIYRQLLEAVEEDLLDAERYERINRILLRLERGWLVQGGLPERPWFRNLFAATDPDSGYAPWMLPGLRWAVERKRAREIDEMSARYVTAYRELAERIEEIGAVLGER